MTGTVPGTRVKQGTQSSPSPQDHPRVASDKWSVLWRKRRWAWGDRECVRSGLLYLHGQQRPHLEGVVWAGPEGRGGDKQVRGRVFQVERAAGAPQEHKPGASEDGKEAGAAGARRAGQQSSEVQSQRADTQGHVAYSDSREFLWSEMGTVLSCDNSFPGFLGKCIVLHNLEKNELRNRGKVLQLSCLLSNQRRTQWHQIQSKSSAEVKVKANVFQNWARSTQKWSCPNPITQSSL